MAGLGEPITSPRRIVAAERQRQALELRKAGATFQQIRRTLGYRSDSSAFEAVESGLAKLITEPAAELRTLELARLDELWFTLWPKMKAGDLPAIDRGLRVMERRAKLLGLDAPTTINVDLLVRNAADAFGLTDDEREALATDVQNFVEQQRAEHGG